MPRQLHHSSLLVFLCVFVLGFASFQEVKATDDPLGKPHIWIKLQKSPVDSVLWAQYFGKPWVAMSETELTDLISWRKELLNIFEVEHIDDANVDWDDPKEHLNGKLEFVDHEIEAEKIRLEKEMTVYVKELKTFIVEESTTMKRLKKNILLNFVVIEELYEEEFQKLGVTYVWYEDKYPKGRYNKQTWILEKEDELRQLKEKEFERRKATLAKESY